MTPHNAKLSLVKVCNFWKIETPLRTMMRVHVQSMSFPAWGWGLQLRQPVRTDPVGKTVLLLDLRCVYPNQMSAVTIYKPYVLHLLVDRTTKSILRETKRRNKWICLRSWVVTQDKFVQRTVVYGGTLLSSVWGWFMVSGLLSIFSCPLTKFAF